MPGPWSQTYQPKRRQPCVRIHAIQASQYGTTSLSRWTSPRLTSTWPPPAIGRLPKTPRISTSQSAIPPVV
ncbi:hypothetical protein GO304_05051 [Ralstonia solanacearum]|nr:hypothetical protein [Ralstonia solanacearum]NJZ81003.1 hypothetical protein [Ralstonia solanacearum]NKA33474.1 hypothetical protein [Ralstonia solanacearum]NKA91430.1 hypothetical protein [Ralstonia solanacearum]NKB15249.1 hypothetical protein [Ralstonia solanacearum]